MPGHVLPNYYCVAPTGAQALQLGSDLIGFGKTIVTGGTINKRHAGSCAASLFVWGTDKLPDDELIAAKAAAKSTDIAQSVFECEAELAAKGVHAGGDLAAFDWKKWITLALQILALVS